MKLKAVVLCLVALVLSGCNDVRDNGQTYANKLRAETNYQNPRDVGRGYVMYEIEAGSVTCREHSRRAELTCWKNGAGE